MSQIVLTVAGLALITVGVVRECIRVFTTLGRGEKDKP